MAENAPSFVIRELTGDKRIIILTGRALPYHPYTLRTNQRIDITWLPGSPEGTATILGSSEDPSIVMGAWKEKFFSSTTGYPVGDSPPFEVDGEPVIVVSEAADLIDEIVRFGALLEVSWNTTRRHGFLTSFEKRWLNPNDLEWSMDFKWISRGERAGPLVTIVDQQLGDAFALVSEKVSKYGDIATDFPKTGDLLSSIQGLQQGIEDLVFKAEDTVENLTRQITSPQRAIRGLIATIRGIRDEAAIMAAFVESELGGGFNGTQETAESVNAGGVPTGNESTPPIALLSYSERLSAEIYRRDLISYSRELFRFAAEQEDQLLTQVESDVLATYQARLDDDLRDVSQKFYGNPHEWKRIMLFNFLPNTELSAGQLLLIPKINPNVGTDVSTF